MLFEMTIYAYLEFNVENPFQNVVTAVQYLLDRFF